MDVVVVTWQAGGASQPAIGLGRLLAGRGHAVRVVAPGRYAARVEAAGCLHRPFPDQAEFDPARGRAMEDQAGFLRETFHGPLLPDAVAAELAVGPADVVVVDYLLRSVNALAERSPATFVPLLHTAHHFHRPTPADDATGRMIDRSRLVLVPIPRELDDWPDPPPQVVHVGPIPEEAPAGAWTPPWPASDQRPLVVVSMGTTYMHHEHLLGRIARAAATLEVRTLLLTGHDLDPGELAGLAGVHVAAYVPHAQVLPAASLVVTHAGMGTIVASLAAGVPLVCLPLGRDQEPNARRVEQLGAGRVLPRDATEAAIAAMIGEALGSSAAREAAARLARVIGAYGDGVRAVDAIERLEEEARC